jgi:hypothetical protein
VISPGGIPDDDALELVELLCFFAELCQAQDSVVSVALSQFLGVDHDPGELANDAARLAAVVARGLGCADMVAP